MVSLNVFSAHLFVRPHCGHYYFGDYYAPRYRDSGFYASFHWHSGGRGYDPIFAYNRWDHRHDHNWVRHCEDNYIFFRDNDRYRPPHTWSAMERLRGENFEDDRGRSRLFANSFDGLVKNPERGQKFRAIDKESRNQFVARSKEMREFGLERRKSEARGIVAEDAAKKVVTREKIARSPFVGRKADKLAKEDAPPVRPEPRGGMLRDKREAKKAGKATPGDGTPETEPGKPGRDKLPADTTREMPDKQPGATDDRKAKPERGPKVTPERKVKPEPEPKVTPERKVKPEAPTREMPKREPKVAPERKAKPEPQVREVPKRQVPPQREVQPQRQIQPKPQREVQPQRQIQPKPQREVQPQRQIQPKPQREVQPQRQIQPKPQREVQPQRQIQPKPQREKNPGKEDKGRPDA